MKIIASFILSLFCFSVFAANDGASLYANFEAFSVGDDVALNSAMGTMSKTNGGVLTFQMHATTAQHKVRGENHPGLLRPVKVASTLYTNTTDTRIWEVSADNGVNTNFLAWSFTASKKVSFGFELTLTNWSLIGNFYNPMLLDGGSTFMALSVIDNNPITMQCETNSGIGQTIGVIQNQTYWVTGLFDSANRLSIFHFYVRTNMQLAGMSAGPQVLNSTVSSLWMGVADAHTKTTGTKYRFGNIILYTNGSVFPVWPGTFLQVPTNLTPTAVSAALTASSDSDSIILPATNATWTSGVTMSKNNVDLAGISPSGLGTNNTVITLSSEFNGFTMSGTYNTISNLQVKGAGTAEDGTAFVMSGAFNRLSRTFTRLLHVPIYAQNFGLADNNVIGDSWHFARVIMDDSFYSTYYPLAWDSTNYFCFEDNVFYWSTAKLDTAPPSNSGITSQDTDSFIVRHNGFLLNNSANMQPLIDFHGDEAGAGLPHPGIALQVYSNYVSKTLGSWDGKFGDIRGSRSLIYSNKVVGMDVLDGITYREERPSDVPNYHVNNSYVWRNYDGASGTVDMSIINSNPSDIIDGTDLIQAALEPLPSLRYPHFLRNEVQTGGGGPGLLTGPQKIRNIRLRPQ